MTVCIASLVGKDRVIMIADKMVTVNMPNIKFERRTSKVIPINTTCALATAGDALIHTDILRRTQELQHAKTIHDIATALHTAYVSERDRLAEELILKPVGLSLNDMRDRQGQLRPEILLSMIQQMANFRFDSVMLIAGLDGSGAHVFCIVPPGTLRCMDAIGYWAIGSGEQHALQTFITSDYDEPISFSRALLVTYEAKKRAEKATGVGQLTDISVITKDGIRNLTDAEIARLELVYQERLKDENDWLKKIDKIDLGLKG
jgi:20S proteasome alpha/beta subunit